MKGHHFELEFWIVTLRRGPAWRNSKHRWLNSRFSSNHYSLARSPLESWGLCCFSQAGWAELMWNGFYMARKKIVMSFPKEHASSRGAGLLRGASCGSFSYVRWSRTHVIVFQWKRGWANLGSVRHIVYISPWWTPTNSERNVYCILLYIYYHIIHRLYYVKLYHTN